MILVAIFYVAVSFVTARLAATAGSHQWQFFWRLSAFALSGVAFVAHLAFETLRNHEPPRRAAWHTGLAAALGGLGLAIVANIHDLGTAAGYRPQMAIALIAWPLLTGVPASLVALVLSSLFKHEETT
jgi:uncharacterized membrane protein YeiB